MVKQNGGAIAYLPSLDYTDEQMFFIAYGQVSLSRYVCTLLTRLASKLYSCILDIPYILNVFFPLFIQTWCGYNTKESVKLLVETNVHSPGPLRYRICKC